MKVIIDNHQIEFQFIDKIRYIELSDYIGLYRIIRFISHRVLDGYTNEKN